MTRTEIITCNGCGKILEPKQVGFFGDIFIKQRPDLQLCLGCAALVCRQVFGDEFQKWFDEYWDIGKTNEAYHHYRYIQKALIEYARLRLGIVGGVYTGRDLIEEAEKKK